MRPPVLALVALLCCAHGRAAADALTLAGGRLAFGVEASAAIANEDRGYFNYTDYERTLVRMGRLGVAAELRATRHLAMLAEVRSYGLGSVDAYALYLRVRPWADRPLHVQAGRIPPVFGAFGRLRYGADNPLVGLPLAYQYLTSLRTDAVAADADELQDKRGRGWLVAYSVGEPGRAPGIPLVDGLRWDTGAQVHVGGERLAFSAAVTQGTLSSPRFRDDNAGKQLSARLAGQPAPGLLLGASAARGAYLDDGLRAALPPGQASRDHAQRAFGLDAEYSRGHWLVRTEAVWTSWEVPAVQAPALPRSLSARAAMIEGRYKVGPRLWLAARLDHLGFARIPGSRGTFTWDAPVTRLEAGGGYRLHRNASIKVAWQRNRRDGGFVQGQDFAIAQVFFWY